MKPSNSEEIRILAIGYLWDKTNGKASQEALKSFGLGAAWAFDVLSGKALVTANENTKEKEGVSYESSNNE